LNFTEDAIEARPSDEARKSFEIATTDLKGGDNALLNAIYLSFLGQLDFRIHIGKEVSLRIQYP
jgi:hypothetical protein